MHDRTVPQCVGYQMSQCRERGRISGKQSGRDNALEELGNLGMGEAMKLSEKEHGGARDTHATYGIRDSREDDYTYLASGHGW
jgi:hypothetical protein